MNLTWIGPTLLVGCMGAVWLIGGPGWFAILLVALAVTVLRSLSQRRSWS